MAIDSIDDLFSTSLHRCQREDLPMTLAAVGLLASCCLVLTSVSTVAQEKSESTTSTQTNSFTQKPANYFGELIEEMKIHWPANRRITIVAHGHSVPAGYFKTPEIRTFDSYPSLLHQRLASLFPTAAIEMVVTAIGGEASSSGANRFEKDVLSIKPDIVLIDYALNDRGIGLKTSRENLEKMISQCTERKIKVILLTPTPDQTEDILQTETPLNSFQEMIRQLAIQHKVAMVDSYEAFRQRVASGTPLPQLMSQVNHPNRQGHELVADLLLSLFSNSESK
jgi:lysophospholipase L1-like esterase